MKVLYKSFLYASLLCFCAIIVLLFLDTGSQVMGLLVIGMFVALAVGVRGTDTVFKSFALPFGYLLRFRRRCFFRNISFR